MNSDNSETSDPNSLVLNFTSKKGFKINYK